MNAKKFAPSIIDVEASGFGAFSYPIEVGVIDTKGEKFCRLIRPETHWLHWDVNAEKIHGISRDLLLEKGLPIKQVCEELNRFIANRVVYSDGWVVDQPWLIKLFHEANTPMLFSVSPLEAILSEGQMALWHQTKDKLIQTSNIKRHRASSDATLIQETFLKTQHMQGKRVVGLQ